MKKLLFLLLIVILSGSLHAQNVPFSSKPVEYAKWEGLSFLPYAAGKFEYHDGGTYNPFGYGFSESAAKTFSQKRNMIVEMLKKSRLLCPPQGVDVFVSSSNNINNTLINPKPTLKGSISMGFLTLYQDSDGKQVRSIETGTWTNIWLNDPDRIVNSQSVVADIFIKPHQIGEFMGYPVFITGRSEIVIVHKNGKPFWSPVTREECLSKASEYFQQEIDKLAKKQKEETADRKKTIENLNDKEKRQKDFESAYKQLLAIDPSAAAELKKTFEETEIQLSGLAEETREDNYEAQDKSQIDELMNSKKQIDEELQSLSPEERKEQAYWGHSDNEEKLSNQIFGLTTKNMPGAEPLIRINPELLDKNRPDSDIQLIVVDWEDSEPLSYNEGKDGYNFQRWKQVEVAKDSTLWKSIFKMVN